jgi:transcriptional regulator with XRE-family HTH domain
MAWRLGAGLTQAELAEAVRGLAADAGSPCGSSTPSCQQISRWENGHDKPGAFYQGLLAAWYRTDPARLGLMGTLRVVDADDHLATADHLANAPAQEEEDVNRRRFLAVSAAPVLFQLDQIRRRIDADLRRVLPSADTDLWAQITSQHVAAYGQVPPAVLLERLAPDLSDVADLVGQYPQQRELTKLAAQLTGLTGALHTDLRDDRAARNWLHTAGGLAAMSGDLCTEYWVAMAQAMSATYPPDHGRVFQIAAQASARLGPHLCAGAAQLTGLVARAHAEAGETARARAALSAAERVAASLPTAQADEVFFGFPGRAMLMYTSSVLTAIGDSFAWTAQADALASYPPSDQVDRPLILLDRAMYLARADDPEHACDIALGAITDLPPGWRVPLLASKARAVGNAIAAASPQAGRCYQETLREAIPA